MNHDELCVDYPSPHVDWTCECGLIAKVRADEQERNSALDIPAFRLKIRDAAWQEGYDAGLADLRAKVQVLSDEAEAHRKYVGIRINAYRAVLNIIDGISND